MYHLGWFLHGYGLQAWNPAVDGPWTGGNATDWMKPDLYVDLAKSLERAGFDFLLLEDQSQIEDTFQGSAEATLRRGFWVPKNDPMPLVPILAQHTRHIGFTPTISSTYYPPFLAARLLTTLDHLTEGRIGFNLVTSLAERGAQNYGLENLPPKATRYEMAHEWVDIVKGLQSSWDSDAIVADVEKGVFADHSKVHRLDYEGKYFRCRGPLNTPPGPQGRIPMVEAGNSPAGRDLAARYAEVMLGVATSPGDMKTFVEDMHGRLRAYGRQPGDCKILFLAAPVVEATDSEARDRQQDVMAKRATPLAMESLLWFLGVWANVDLGHIDLDMSSHEILTEFERMGRSKESMSAVEVLFKGQEGRTLRQALITNDMRDVHLGLVGSPDTVAAMMDEVIAETGADGFLINHQTIRRTIAEICDGLAPVLRRRNSIRDGYSGSTLRHNLREF